MKINLYGRKIEVVKIENRWTVFMLGDEGKKRVAENITVPSAVDESGVVGYLADMYHEWATPENLQVFEF